ncbi:MAG: hypothetical protein WC450_09600, partial [Candidatus Omnitrophota bacterium]
MFSLYREFLFAFGEALRRLHDNGYIHYMAHLANVYIDEHRQVKFTDFEAAQIIRDYELQRRADLRLVDLAMVYLHFLKFVFKCDLFDMLPISEALDRAGNPFLPFFAGYFAADKTGLRLKAVPHDLVDTIFAGMVEPLSQVRHPVVAQLVAIEEEQSLKSILSPVHEGGRVLPGLPLTSSPVKEEGRTAFVDLVKDAVVRFIKKHIEVSEVSLEDEVGYYQTAIDWVKYILGNYQARFGGHKLVFIGGSCLRPYQAALSLGRQYGVDEENIVYLDLPRAVIDNTPDALLRAYLNQRGLFNGEGPVAIFDDFVSDGKTIKKIQTVIHSFNPAIEHVFYPLLYPRSWPLRREISYWSEFPELGRKPLDTAIFLHGDAKNRDVRRKILVAYEEARGVVKPVYLNGADLNQFLVEIGDHTPVSHVDAAKLSEKSRATLPLVAKLLAQMTRYDVFDKDEGYIELKAWCQSNPSGEADRQDRLFLSLLENEKASSPVKQSSDKEAKESIKRSSPVDHKAGMIFLVADLKITPDKQVKVCEFGAGFYSEFYDRNSAGKTTMQLFWEHVRPYQVPVWVAVPASAMFLGQGDVYETLGISGNLPDGSLIGDIRHLPAYIRDRKFGRKAPVFAPADLSTYSGIVIVSGYKADFDGGYEAGQNSVLAQLRKEYPDFLVLDYHTDRSDPSEYIGNKFLSRLMLGDADAILARGHYYLKEYPAGLTRKIIRDIPADRYVIKPVNASHAKGVIACTKEELGQILKLLFGGKGDLRQKADRLYPGLEEAENPILPWLENEPPVFYVQEYVPAETMRFEGRPYEPTARAVAVITADRGNIRASVIDHYYKFPLESAGRKTAREHGISRVESREPLSRQDIVRIEAALNKAARHIVRGYQLSFKDLVHALLMSPEIVYNAYGMYLLSYNGRVPENEKAQVRKLLPAMRNHPAMTGTVKDINSLLKKKQQTSSSPLGKEIKVVRIAFPAAWEKTLRAFEGRLTHKGYRLTRQNDHCYFDAGTIQRVVLVGGHLDMCVKEVLYATAKTSADFGILAHIYLPLDLLYMSNADFSNQPRLALAEKTDYITQTQIRMMSQVLGRGYGIWFDDSFLAGSKEGSERVVIRYYRRIKDLVRVLEESASRHGEVFAVSDRGEHLSSPISAEEVARVAYYAKFYADLFGVGIKVSVENIHLRRIIPTNRTLARETVRRYKPYWEEMLQYEPPIVLRDIVGRADYLVDGHHKSLGALLSNGGADVAVTGYVLTPVKTVSFAALETWITANNMQNLEVFIAPYYQNNHGQVLLPEHPQKEPASSPLVRTAKVGVQEEFDRQEDTLVFHPDVPLVVPPRYSRIIFEKKGSVISQKESGEELTQEEVFYIRNVPMANFSSVVDPDIFEIYNTELFEQEKIVTVEVPEDLREFRVTTIDVINAAVHRKPV